MKKFFQILLVLVIGTFFSSLSAWSSNTSKICDIKFTNFADSIAARKELQKGLKILGLYSGAIDGVFGQNSCKGLKELLKQAKQANRNSVNFKNINLFLKKSELRGVTKKPENSKGLNVSMDTTFDFEKLDIYANNVSSGKWFSIDVVFENIRLHPLGRIVPEISVKLDANVKQEIEFHAIRLEREGFNYSKNFGNHKGLFYIRKSSKFKREVERFFNPLNAEQQAIFVGLCNYFSNQTNVENIIKSVNVPSAAEEFMAKRANDARAQFDIRDIGKNCKNDIAKLARKPLPLMAANNLQYRALKIRPSEFDARDEGIFYTGADITITGAKLSDSKLKIRPNLTMNFTGVYTEKDFENGFHGMAFEEGKLLSEVPEQFSLECCEGALGLNKADTLKKYFNQASDTDRAILLATCGSLSDPEFVDKILSELRNSQSMPERYRLFWGSSAHAERLIEKAELCNYELTGSTNPTIKFQQISSAANEGESEKSWGEVLEATGNKADEVVESDSRNTKALEEKLAKAEANNESMNSALLTAIAERNRLQKEKDDKDKSSSAYVAMLQQSISEKDKLISEKEKELSRTKSLLLDSRKESSRIEKDFKSQIVLSETIITSLEKKYEDAKADTGENSTRLDELKSQIKRLKQDLQLSGNQLSEQKSAWLGERDKLKYQLSNLKNVDQKQKSDLESIRLENKRLNSELATSVDEIALLKETLDNEKEEIVKLRERTAVAQSNAAQIPQLKEKVKKLEKQLSLQGQLANAQNWRDVAEQDPDWSTWLVDMPLKQMLFCDLVSEYEILLSQALASQNQIRMNLVLKDRKLELDGLLPRGELEGWIGRVNAVTQTADGDAAVLLELPCDVNIGSGITSINGENKWAATIPYGDRMYRELVKVGKGDFVILNAKLLEVDEGELGEPEYKFASNLANDKNLPDNFKSENETFIAFVNYLVEAKR